MNWKHDFNAESINETVFRNFQQKKTIKKWSWFIL